MIDMIKAKQAFEKYLDGFDREDARIKLKIVHTYGVVDITGKLCMNMNLSREVSDLAELIALLHDIGRFEQVRQFASFEPTVMDHASYGVELLFGEQRMIREFIHEDTWDEMIRYAIARHSDYLVASTGNELQDYLAWLIRDADKLDNCRVKLEDSVEAMLGCSAEEIGRQKITPAIWESCMRCEPILSQNRITKLDYWVSYIAYFFDINFAESAKIILENDYAARIIRRIPYASEETEKQMWQLYDLVSSHLEARTEGRFCPSALNNV